jgi:hypothetical protein
VHAVSRRIFALLLSQICGVREARNGFTKAGQSFSGRREKDVKLRSNNNIGDDDDGDDGDDGGEHDDDGD